MSIDPVRDYYARTASREWSRLTESDDGALEFAHTCAMLTRYLSPESDVLDLGGGPGRYTIWLAQAGHIVTLADLSPELLALARTRIDEAGIGGRVAEIHKADARDLSAWADESFDAVICLGPFYHLPEQVDRERAAAELARVLRPGGVAVVALMSRATLLRRTVIVPEERRHLRDPGWLTRLLVDGRFDNNVPGRFPHAYGVRPQEVAPFFASFGLSPLTLTGAEGILAWLGGAVGELARSDLTAYQAALDASIELASDPYYLGLSGHLLYVGRRAPFEPSQTTQVSTETARSVNRQGVPTSFRKP